MRKVGAYLLYNFSWIKLKPFLNRKTASKIRKQVLPKLLSGLELAVDD